MGIQSVAVYSIADANSPFVQEADQAIFIGEAAPAESYLDQDKIINAAKQASADAIHPGYGFLSEQADFAKRCQKEGLIFIGPNPEAIAAMGSKSAAKNLMDKHKVPTVPGYQGKEQDLTTLKNAAEKIGFPVLLKATAGGGGKGMRIVHQAKDIEKAIEAAKRESMSAFGNDELIVEKYIAAGRHIEFQIFGDQHGNTIHLLERECSLQRRYQKVIEESPSPIMDEVLRQKMGEAAVKAAQALNYDNAGTVEFIFDDKSGDFYFLEVNTRLQVEHPVTEEITGLDLVAMQIESAQGYPLSIQQADVQGKGYAIECRLYAEDPANDFLPVSGKIEQLIFPQVEGLRVESAVVSGSDISIFYDPMIAKLIVWDKDRAAALRKMQFVLRKLVCLGTQTNQAFLLQLLTNEQFIKGEYDTQFIEQKIKLGESENYSQPQLAYACTACVLQDWSQRNEKRSLLRSLPSGWRNNFSEYQKTQFLFKEQALDFQYRKHKDGFEIKFGDLIFNAQIIEKLEHRIRLSIDGVQQTYHLSKSGLVWNVHQAAAGSIRLAEVGRFPAKEGRTEKGGYEAPMPSQVIKLLVKEGQEVKSGDGLIVLSSMKMENTIEAAEDGIVEEIFAEEGGNIEAGFLLLKLKEQ